MYLPPGFARAFQYRTANDRSFRDLFFHTLAFVSLLLVCEFFAGQLLIAVATRPFEDDRRAQLIAGWQALLAARKQLQARSAADLAHRDRTARAFTAPDAASAVTKIFHDRPDVVADFDLTFAIGPGRQVYYGALRELASNDIVDTQNSPETIAAARDRAIEKEFLEIAALKVRDWRPELEATPGASDPVNQTITAGDLYWHHITRYGEEVYLLTLSPVCDDSGYPVTDGFVLFGDRIDGIFRDARRQLNLREIYLSERTPLSAYVSVPLPGYRADEMYFVALEPAFTISEIARTSLYVLLVLQALLAYALAGYALPYFTTGDATTAASVAPKASKLSNAAKATERAMPGPETNPTNQTQKSNQTNPAQTMHAGDAIDPAPNAQAPGESS